MDNSLPTALLDTERYLTVGSLLEKLQFEDVDSRICVCVANPPDTPPGDVTLLVNAPDGNMHDLFIWEPK